MSASNVASSSAAASAAPSSAAAAGCDHHQAGSSNGLPIMLSRSRRADVSEFKGKTFVNIREYYEVRNSLHDDNATYHRSLCCCGCMACNRACCW